MLELAQAPEPGQIVRVRQRQYLVEGIVAPTCAADATLVRLSCLDDDAQGQELEVLWEAELDAEVLTGSGWDHLATRSFDAPRLFSAYLHTLRWNCVTATNPRLFQSPFRAGIRINSLVLVELRAWNSLVLVVAHELAHVVLNHSMFSLGPEADRCEREVFRLVCAWGFTREAERQEALREAAGAEDANPSEQLVAFVSLVRAAGIEALWFDEEQRPGEACVEFASAGDVEMFLNIAQSEYRAVVEQWDEGGDGKHSFRVQMPVFFPLGDIPRLMGAFTEYTQRSRPSQGSGKPPQHGGHESSVENPPTRPS
jgi:hypothetical protein